MNKMTDEQCYSRVDVMSRDSWQQIEEISDGDVIDEMM